MHTSAPIPVVCFKKTTLLEDARELVTERHADPRVGDEAVVEVQVGSANARARDSHDGIFGMQDCRLRFAIDADAMTPAIVHREHGRCSRRITVFAARKTVMVPLYPATPALGRATGGTTPFRRDGGWSQLSCHP
jgi:hypothetical protein